MSAGLAWLDANVNVRPTPVVLVTSSCTDRDEPCATVVAVAVGNPDRTVTPELLNVTLPWITWLNSLPLVVRLRTTTINHLPAVGFATDRFARAVGVVDPTPWSVVVGVASATT